MSGRSADLGGWGWVSARRATCQTTTRTLQGRAPVSGGPFRALAVVTVYLEEGCQLNTLGTAAPDATSASDPSACQASCSWGHPLWGADVWGRSAEGPVGGLPERRCPGMGPEDGNRWEEEEETLRGSGLEEALQALE